MKKYFQSDSKIQTEMSADLCPPIISTLGLFDADSKATTVL